MEVSFGWYLSAFSDHWPCNLFWPKLAVTSCNWQSKTFGLIQCCCFYGSLPKLWISSHFNFSCWARPMILTLSLIMILFCEALFREFRGSPSLSSWLHSMLRQRVVPAVWYWYTLHSWCGSWATSKDFLGDRFEAMDHWYTCDVPASEMQEMVMKGRIYYAHLFGVTLMNKSTKENTSRGKTPTTTCLPLINIAHKGGGAEGHLRGHGSVMKLAWPCPTITLISRVPKSLESKTSNEGQKLI